MTTFVPKSVINLVYSFRKMYFCIELIVESYAKKEDRNIFGGMERS